MKRELLSGNEAVARGAYEAGVTVASAYPGTPSTEILENIAHYNEIYSEWAPNEKVALEVVAGSSIAGARSICAMKHVGLNVAADPMFTLAYIGVSAGCVIVTADDPGLHSSQNEQDNRYYARHAKIPMIEPSDSQEAKDFLIEAFDISEKFKVPILFRMTTRICHSKGMVYFSDRKEPTFKEYKRDISAFVSTPANNRIHHTELEKKLKEIEKFSNNCALNKMELNESEIGIITSGVSYQYAKEIFGNDASYLKLGFTYPLPEDLIMKFSENVKRIYVIEENEPIIENFCKSIGLEVIGKEKIPIEGELNPDIIQEKLLDIVNPVVGKNVEKTIGRPPTLCSGCPHRGIFYELSKRKNIVISGDIGCYTLGCTEPLNAMDTVICMGASISAAHGFSKAFEKSGQKMKAIAVIGDSTFFHSGITSLLDITYNNGNAAVIILDNRITAMTGHQENPGTGYTLIGDETPEVNIEGVVKALGVRKVDTINPNDLKQVKESLDKAIESDEPYVIIARWPCALKKLKEEEKKMFDKTPGIFRVNSEKCRKCKMCLKAGCPSISFDDEIGSIIDETTCVGCSVCAQICPFNAIERVGDE